MCHIHHLYTETIYSSHHLEIFKDNSCLFWEFFCTFCCVRLLRYFWFGFPSLQNHPPPPPNKPQRNLNLSESCTNQPTNLFRTNQNPKPKPNQNPSPTTPSCGFLQRYKVQDVQCIQLFSFKTAFGGGRSSGFGLSARLHDDKPPEPIVFKWRGMGIAPINGLKMGL